LYQLRVSAIRINNPVSSPYINLHINVGATLDAGLIGYRDMRAEIIENHSRRGVVVYSGVQLVINPLRIRFPKILRRFFHRYSIPAERTLTWPEGRHSPHHRQVTITMGDEIAEAVYVIP